MPQIVLPTKKNIRIAAQQLIQGNLVVFPTETVYGLGADALNQSAVLRIYETKQRPLSHPLIVHIPEKEKIDYWANQIPDYVEKIANKFWPGPLTIILQKNKHIPEFITGGQNTIALRVPSNKIALKILEEFIFQGGYGIVAPSANNFGAVSPTSAFAAHEELSPKMNLDNLIIDGGNCEIGIESTIIECTETKIKILRPGFVTREKLSSIVDIDIENNPLNSCRAPGLFKSHYQPRAKVKISSECDAGDGFIALQKIATPNGAIRLSEPKTVEEYARDLYKAFRLADTLCISRISVVLAEGSEYAEAVNDRIKKAAGSSG